MPAAGEFIVYLQLNPIRAFQFETDRGTPVIVVT